MRRLLSANWEGYHLNIKTVPKKSKISLWRKVGCVTSKHQAPQEYATNDRKEVADVHCHHRQHAAERLAFRFVDQVLNNWQKISDPRNYCIEQCPGHVPTDPPRPASPFPISVSGSNILLVKADSIVLLLARDYDLASLQIDISPFMLLHCPIGEKTAENGGQSDDKDAIAGVLALGRRRPLGWKKWGACRREKSSSHHGGVWSGWRHIHDANGKACQDQIIKFNEGKTRGSSARNFTLEMLN